MTFVFLVGYLAHSYRHPSSFILDTTSVLINIIITLITKGL